MKILSHANAKTQTQTHRHTDTHTHTEREKLILTGQHKSLRGKSLFSKQRTVVNNNKRKMLIFYLFVSVFGSGVSGSVQECFFIFIFYVALRPRRRDDLLGTGTEWEGDRVIGSTAETARKRPERP